MSIDERRLIVQLQKKLKEFECQSHILRVQQEESLDGILIVDAEWNILSYNQRFVSMWEIPSHIIETKDDRACINTVLDKLNNPEQFLAKVEYLMAHPTQKSQEILELKDQRWFDRSSAPIIDNENKLNGRIWFFRDITDVKRAQESLEQQNQKLEDLVRERTKQLEKVNERLEERVAIRTLDLKEQKERLQAITENVPGVVFQFYSSNTGESGVHYTSPKLYDIFGLEYIEDPSLFFQIFSQNIHKEDKQSWVESIRNVIEKQIPWKWKGRYVKPSGEIIWFEGHSIPTVRKNEIVFDGILIDITEKIEKEAEKLEITLQQEQLKKIESLKTMAGAIAHQFNNSMMAVLGNLELMILSLPDDSGEHQMALNASTAARDATQIGSMMLSYVGQKRLQSQVVSFVDIVLESVDGLKGNLDTSISLIFSPPDKGLYCSIDGFQMKEVVESIFNNSVESLKGASGTIKVTFGMDSFATKNFPIPFQEDMPNEGMFAFCQIEDNGHGIRSEILNQIFEPFFTTRFVGRGLGLALTVGIMRRHNGAITVASTPGKGTTVRILLPVSSELQSTTTPFVAEGGETVQRELSGDILLADDEPILLIVNKMMLERLGFTVHTAVNGQEAIDKVRKQDVDYCAAVLDVIMPGIDGIEAMKEIRKIDPTVPVLLISGYSQSDFPFQSGVEKLPDGFMEKPVQLSEMRRNLERVLH